MVDWRNGVAIAVVIIVLILACAWGSVRATEADRESRSRQAEVCATIEDEGVRAACVAGVRP